LSVISIDPFAVGKKTLTDSVFSELSALNTLYAHHKFQRVVDRFEQVRQVAAPDTAANVGTLQIAAQAYSHIGNFSASADTFLSAAAIHALNKSPEASVCMRNAFAALQRALHHTAAEWVALRSLSLPRECDGDAELLRYAVSAAFERRDLNAASNIMAATSLYRKTRVVALETLLDMARQPERYGATDAAARSDTFVDARYPKLSVIICGRDDKRYARFVTECTRALCSSHFEIIRIADATSMCEGYNRGTKAATGELLLYCHDDIEFISDGVHRALINTLADFDVACCVGSSVVDGPTWMCRDATYSQGVIAASDAQSGHYSIGIIGVPNSRAVLASGDGFFIACRPAAAQSLGWDEATFDSFHLYDIDFCLRARHSRLRIGVARDVTINYFSQGSFDAGWHEHAERFLRKHNLPAALRRRINGPRYKLARALKPLASRAI